MALARRATRCSSSPSRASPTRARRSVAEGNPPRIMFTAESHSDAPSTLYSAAQRVGVSRANFPCSLHSSSLFSERERRRGSRSAAFPHGGGARPGTASFACARGYCDDLRNPQSGARAAAFRARSGATGACYTLISVCYAPVPRAKVSLFFQFELLFFRQMGFKQSSSAAVRICAGPAAAVGRCRVCCAFRRRSSCGALRMPLTVLHKSARKACENPWQSTGGRATFVLSEKGVECPPRPPSHLSRRAADFCRLSALTC